MKLTESGFYGIKNKQQLWETRIYDEKRKMINIGDEIEFILLPELKEKINVVVEKIIRAKDFKELFTKINPTEANYPKEYTIEECAKVMEKYYSQEEQSLNGVIAFKINIK